MSTYRVVTVRHGEAAWSVRVLIDGEVIRVYDSPDAWLESAAEAEFERKRISAMLERLKDA